MAPQLKTEKEMFPLVVKDMRVRSNKMEKAKALGRKVITVEELEDLLKS